VRSKPPKEMFFHVRRTLATKACLGDIELTYMDLAASLNYRENSTADVDPAGVRTQGQGRKAGEIW